MPPIERVKVVSVALAAGTASSVAIRRANSAMNDLFAKVRSCFFILFVLLLKLVS